MATGLVDLPIWVLDMIVRRLDKAELLALARSCKCMNSYISPYLFKSISYDMIADSAFPLDSLLQGLLTHPEYGEATKYLSFSDAMRENTLSGNGPGFQTSDPDQRPVNHSVLQRVQELYGSPLPVALEKLIRSHYPPVMSALILSRLPNLGTIRIGGHHLIESKEVPGATFGGVLSKILTHNQLATASKPWFPALRSVYLSPDLDHELNYIFATANNPGRLTRDIRTSEAMRVFLAQPAIELLETTLAFDEGFSWAADAPMASRLTVLALTSSEAPTEVLPKLLALTPNLEVFQYEACLDISDKWSHRKYRRLDPRNIMTALRQVKATLTAVNISVGWYDGSGMDEPDMPTTRFGFQAAIGSFGDFEELQSLELPLIFAWGLAKKKPKLRDILPPHLVELVLRDDGWYWDRLALRSSSFDTMPQLFSELRGCSDWAPELQYVVLLVNERLKWDGVSERALQDEFEAECETVDKWFTSSCKSEGLIGSIDRGCDIGPFRRV